MKDKGLFIRMDKDDKEVVQELKDLGYNVSQLVRRHLKKTLVDAKRDDK